MGRKEVAEGERKGLILVSKLRLSCPLSAEFVLGVVLVQQFDVREGEVAALAVTFALPLAVHVYFGHLHHVAHLGRERREKGREFSSKESQRHIKNNRNRCPLKPNVAGTCLRAHSSFQTFIRSFCFCPFYVSVKYQKQSSSDLLHYFLTF